MTFEMVVHWSHMRDCDGWHQKKTFCSSGGSKGVRPQKSPDSVIFDIQILQNIAVSGVGASPTRLAPPPYGKSWIPTV